MASATSKTPRILIIAGSDSGGGAGIQADIKTVTMLGGHAMTAITAITAQNTTGVTAIHPVPAEMVLAQIDSVIADIRRPAFPHAWVEYPATRPEEAEARLRGATIAIINGRLKAGLSPAEIEILGQTGRSVVKVSSRDIPFIVASGYSDDIAKRPALANARSVMKPFSLSELVDAVAATVATSD